MNEHIKSFGDWDEIRVAFHVARLGTLSAAAGYLGVHHATVIRHIDALETRLGCKLFQRNPRGYNPTEAGLELLRSASEIEERLWQLASKLKGRSEAVSGELIVTSLSALSQQLTPLLVEFGRLHQEVRITYIAEDRPLQLEYGEAHIALRAGPKPQEADNVVQNLTHVSGSLFAHKSYVEKFGLLKNDEDAANHQFIGRIISERRAPMYAWLDKYVPDHCITYRVSDLRDYEDAIHMGAGIGFMSFGSASLNPDLIQMRPALPEWEAPLWLVTHVDLHRTAKVQVLANFLKEHFK